MGFSTVKIYVEKKRREKEYEEIKKSHRSPFKGKEIFHKDIFLNAMVIGYYKKLRSSLEGTRHDLFETSVLNSEEEWLIKSIAIAEKENLEILLNEKEILKIAEEYANAGILILYDLILGGSPGDPLKKIESYVKKYPK